MDRDWIGFPAVNANRLTSIFVQVQEVRILPGTLSAAASQENTLYCPGGMPEISNFPAVSVIARLVEIAAAAKPGFGYQNDRHAGRRLLLVVQHRAGKRPRAIRHGDIEYAGRRTFDMQTRRKDVRTAILRRFQIETSICRRAVWTSCIGQAQHRNGIVSRHEAMHGEFVISVSFDRGKRSRRNRRSKVDDQLRVVASTRPAFDRQANSQVESRNKTHRKILNIPVANVDRHSSERFHSVRIDGIGSEEVRTRNDVFEFERTRTIRGCCVVADAGRGISWSESNVW